MSDVRGLNPGEYKDTLLGSFLEDDCLDELRQIATDLGARPYRVYLVRTRWSGNKRGRGVEVVEFEEEVLPTPKVSLDGIQLQMLDVGTDENGGLMITEISPRYRENQLLGRSPEGKEPDENATFAWEVVLTRDDPEATRRRRFQVQGVPQYDPTGLQWRVRLVRAGSDRDAEGNPG